MADTRLQVIIDAKNNLDKELKKAQGELKKTASDVKELGAAFTAVAVGGGAAIVSFAKSAGRMEQSAVAFETMLGSAEAAQMMLSDLADFAAKTPFEFVGIQQTAKQLMAMGIETEKVIPTLKSLGDVSAGLSVPIEQIAYAYGQVRSANQLLGTELRQFVNAGVPLLSELAVMFGVTEQEVKKMVEQGKVGFADVEKAFQNMSGEGGKFFDLMDKQSGTLLGKWSNLQDAIEQLKIALGQALLPALKSMVTLMVSITESIQKFAENNPKIAKLAGTMLMVVTAVSALGAALIAAGLAWKAFNVSVIAGNKLLLQGAIKILSFNTATLSLSGVLTAVKAKMASLKAVIMGLNPVIALSVVAIGSWIMAWQRYKKVKEEAIATMDGIITKAEEEKNKYLQAIEALNGADKQRAILKQETHNRALELQAAEAEHAKLMEEKASKAAIQTAKEKIDAAQLAFDRQVRINQDTLADLEGTNRQILVSLDNLAAAQKRLGQEEYNNRVRLLEQYKVDNAEAQQAILDLQGGVNAEIVRLVQAQHDEQRVAAANLKADMEAQFRDPITQKVVISFEGMSKTLNETWKIKKAFSEAQDEIEKRSQQIGRSVAQSVGGGASKAADSFADFADKVKKEADSIAGKIKNINKSIQDLRKQTEEANKSNRESLASAYADAEMRAKELNKQRKEIEDDLRDATTASEKERLREQLAEVESNLERENQALDAAKAYQGEISKELSEARKLARMTELERAIYAYNQEKIKIKEVFNEKMKLIQEERAAVIEQKQELVAMVEEKNEELKKLYGDDTEGFRSELDNQVKLLDETARQMIDMYNSIAEARANALGGKAVKVKFSGGYGARATGGPVNAGNAYRVGERGPEMFVPNVSGRIIPNNKMGGNQVNVTINVGGNVATERDLAESIMDVFTRELKLSNQIT